MASGVSVPSRSEDRPHTKSVAKPRSSRAGVSSVACRAGPPMFNRVMIRTMRTSVVIEPRLPVMASPTSEHDAPVPWPGWFDDLLRCPRCSASVAGVGDDVVCENGHSFPIVAEIPRFTSPSSYADSFGFEWTMFDKLQLDDGERHESEDALVAKTGLTPEDVRNALVLDAGCGMGRFSDVLARWGAKVVGVDLSRAVESAARNVPDRERAVFVQADLRTLPFRREAFDIVVSLGVLHHTPNTYSAFHSLVPMVKPDGTMCVWVYSRRLHLLLGSQVLRSVTKRLPRDVLLQVVRKATPRVYDIKRRIPSIARGLDVLIPISNHPDPAWRILDTFDWYSPRYQHKHSFEEVERWFDKQGFVDIRRLAAPVAVRGRRTG